jgi:tetrahydromethanopterin S-methyltransferase subunit A
MTLWVLLWINDTIQFLICSVLTNNLAIHFRFGFENAVGKLCEALIPISANYCMGRKGRSIAICTLASMKLLDDICRSPDMMDRILIVGRLLSENRGIDAIIRFTLLHDELHHIILCGKESIGHEPGQALLSLHRHGVHHTKSGEQRIVGAKGHTPILNSSTDDINSFRTQIARIHNLIGVDNPSRVRETIESIGSANTSNWHSHL